jgi:DNA-binding response OmpR family regulator
MNEHVCFYIHANTVDVRLLGDVNGERRHYAVRQRDSSVWGRDRVFSHQEFQLLRQLCARWSDEARSPSAIRGLVSTAQLVAALPHSNDYPDGENVRQTVLRVRRKLADAGAGGIIETSPGEGYYLACPVTRDGARPT